MAIKLDDHQRKAIAKMKNGCILCGGVGTGKSRTALSYYFVTQEGGIDDPYFPMSDPPKDLYIITTARKRDTLDWEEEMVPFLIYTDPDASLYDHKVVVDSWNNIAKYKDVYGAFFIFDEQRVVGSGAWVKAFLNIARKNQWILLSATPGDTWQDYIPVFVANGFYKNKTEFIREHIIYSRFSKFPKIDRYINTGRLVRHRNDILIPMKFERHTIHHHMDIDISYNMESYKSIMKNRWNPYEDKPVETASELCYLLRKVVNSEKSRKEAVLNIFKEKNKVIIFYNFDYELDILRNIDYGQGVEVAEWNGHKHQPVPTCKSWVYLVQYTAGAEGWNCIKTDTIIFYSQNYSYKLMIQSSGRIDRMNTPYIDLYYYHLKSKASIDLAINRALKTKKSFNESGWVKTR